MARSRYIVEDAFYAWKPLNPERLAMRKGFTLFAEVEGADPYIRFYLDAQEWETERPTFLKCTRLARPEEILPPSY